jgi:hypothetical protein
MLNWLLLFRRLKNVYLENNHLKVDDELISFKDILSIKRLTFLRYKIYYLTQQQQVESFVFSVLALPFVTPTYIKKIKSLILISNII